MAIYAPTTARPTALITNRDSAGSVLTAAVNDGNAKAVASGALTANTLATVVSITGSGYLFYCAAGAADTTSRTIRLQVILDGSTAFDATSSTCTVSNSGLCAVGHPLSGASSSFGSFVRFNSSALIKVASSLTETDKINVYYVAHTE